MQIYIFSKFYWLVAWMCFMQCTRNGVPQHQSTTACYGDEFTDILCGPLEGVVQVTEAVYSASNCASNPGAECCPRVTDTCSITISDQHPIYFEEIEQSCNGGKSCSGLEAGRTSALGQCGVTFTDYVRIYYTCVRDRFETTVDEYYSTSLENQTQTPTEEPSKSSFTWGIPTGIVVGLSIFLIPLAVVYIQSKMKNSGKSDIDSYSSDFSDSSLDKDEKSASRTINGQPIEIRARLKREDSTDCYGDNIYESIEIDNNSPSLRKQSKKRKSKQKKRNNRGSISNKRHRNPSVDNGIPGDESQNCVTSGDDSQGTTPKIDEETEPTSENNRVVATNSPNLDCVYINTITVDEIVEESGLAKRGSLPTETKSEENSENFSKIDEQEGVDSQNVYIDILPNDPESKTYENIC